MKVMNELEADLQKESPATKDQEEAPQSSTGGTDEIPSVTKALEACSGIENYDFNIRGSALGNRWAKALEQGEVNKEEYQALKAKGAKGPAGVQGAVVPRPVVGSEEEADPDDQPWPYDSGVEGFQANLEVDH